MAREGYRSGEQVAIVGSIFGRKAAGLAASNEFGNSKRSLGLRASCPIFQSLAMNTSTRQACTTPISLFREQSKLSGRHVPKVKLRLKELGSVGARADAPGVKIIASRDGRSKRNLSMVLNLTFLATEIIEAILKDATPATLSASHIAQKLPLDWEEQRRWIAAQA